MALRIDNSRVSERPFGDAEKTSLELAAAADGQATMEEAYCHVSALALIGPHHEVRYEDGEAVMILNRQGVWEAAEKVRTGGMEGLKSADRKRALSHLRRHIDAMQDIAIGE